VAFSVLPQLSRFDLITLIRSAFSLLYSLLDYDMLRLMIGLFGRLTVTAAYFICLQYASEIFPTVLRGRGVALCEVAGGVAILGSPAIVYLVG
jgi:hypothetical protein